MSLPMDSRKNWSSSTTETNDARGMPPPGARLFAPHGRFHQRHNGPLSYLAPKNAAGAIHRHVNVSLRLLGDFQAYNALINTHRRPDVGKAYLRQSLIASGSHD